MMVYSRKSRVYIVYIRRVVQGKKGVFVELGLGLFGNRE